MTEVWFVRHAEPNYDNHDDLLRELTEKGLKDRAKVCDFFADKEITVALSSPYKRSIDTIRTFTDSRGLEIETVDDLRERKVSDEWVEDFKDFTARQWEDFSFRLPGGECLREVQDRNIAALKGILKKYKGEKIIIGSHGTALSCIINYYDDSYGYEDFRAMVGKMPWVVEFIFDDDMNCLEINKFDI